MAMAADPHRRLSGIEAGRGIAASLVVMYHVSRHVDAGLGAPLLRAVFQFGHAGVDFFFVISGFVILHVHGGDIGQPRRLGRYLWRRFTRLMPMYWVALALTVLIDLMTAPGRSELTGFGWSITLLPSNAKLILDIAWTLRFEIFFYAVFALLVVSRRAGLTAFAIWLACILSAFVVPGLFRSLPDQFSASFGIEFFLGMAAAWLAWTRSIAGPGRVFGFGVLCFALMAGLEDAGYMNGYAGLARLAYGIPAAMVIVGLVGLEQRQPLRIAPVLRVLGSASYSIYLVQFIFIASIWQALLVIDWFVVVPPVLQFVAIAGSTIAGGVIVSQCIETPLIAWVRRRSARPRPLPILG